MANTVEELVIRAKPSGLDETTEGIEEMESGIEESAESMGDATEQMDELSSRWTGAFRSMVAGMALAVGGLLTQVPVIGESMAGLNAIMQAFSFQVDQLLRDLGVGGLTGVFFGIADAIFRLDGALGDLAGGVAVISTIVAGAIAGWVSYLSVTQGIGVALSALAGKITGFLGILTGLVAGSIAAGAAFGTLLGLFGVAVLEVTGVMDAIRSLGQLVATTLPAWARDGLLAFIGYFLGPLAVVGAAIQGFISGVLDGGLSEGIDRAVSNAKTVLGVFETAWENTLSRIKTTVTDFISWVRGKFNTEIAGGVSIGDIAGSVGDLAGGVADVGAGGGFRAGRSEPPVIQLDGKDVTASTGRWRADETSRRGRNG